MFFRSKKPNLETVVAARDVKALLDLTQHKDTAVSEGAARALASSTFPEATDLFVSRLWDPDTDVRAVAKQQLLSIGPEAADRVAEKLSASQAWSWAAIEVLTEIGPSRAVECLLERCHSNSGESLVNLLSKLSRDARVVEFLATRYDSIDWDSFAGKHSVVVDTAKCIARTHDGRWLPALIESVHRIDTERPGAEDAIGYVIAGIVSDGSTRSCNAVTPLLTMESPRVRQKVLRELENHGAVLSPASVERVVWTSLGDDDPESRRLAVELLHRVDTEVIESVLVEMLTATGMRFLVAEALERRHWKPSNPIERALFALATRTWRWPSAPYVTAV